MKLKDCFTIPKVDSGATKVWSRNFMYFKKTWLVSLFWIVLEPVIYLGAIGFGLGAFVNNMGGMSYIEFFFPALLSTTAMMVAFFEGTYGNYTKLTHQKTYATIMLTRVGPEEIVAGELLWATSKGFFGVIGVTIVALFFGLIDSYRILLALPILFLMSALFSCIGMILTSYARNYDSFIYSTSGLIVPMSLLSGTYFPLDQLPAALRYVAYLFPLTHAVAAVREVLHQGPTLWVLIHVLILLAATWICMNIAFFRIRKKLLK
ncbi:ABC transporter permease [Bdellovibrio bacteriovorus]|uniref:Transport permease protein n=1 Tax=Bdellovibrio bacteriovorus str. Tiberius TaxID=1069642 RepID=K7Z6K4_BDEBC|nr:ABC transporter permease [Bdellovibrio bacteriovorus]AFX99838.1 ABC transporter, permease protein [Bdellovibrio bacteriovorus str. Tiberius]